MELSGPVFDDMYSNFKTSEFQPGASACEVGYDTLLRAHCSYDNQPEKDQSRGRQASRSPAQPQQQSPEDHAQQTIREAEAAKAQIFNKTGEKLTPQVSFDSIV